MIRAIDVISSCTRADWLALTGFVAMLAALLFLPLIAPLIGHAA